MPFTFFSHQSPVLPLKLIRPRWFSGTALALGSMSPDFEYFFPILPITLNGIHLVRPHSIPGLFVHSLPYTLLLVWIVKKVLARPLALHLPDLGAFHLRDYAALEATAPRSLSSWIVAAYSALLGALSHILWDSFTHEGRWGVQEIPTLQIAVYTIGGYTIHGYRVLQHASTVLGGVVAIILLYYIGKNRLLWKWANLPVPQIHRLPASSYFWFWTPPLLFGLLRFTLALNQEGMFTNWDSLRHWVNVFLRTTTWTFIGLLLTSLIYRWRMKGKGGEENIIPMGGS